jgi:hypothetical protein
MRYLVEIHRPTLEIEVEADSADDACDKAVELAIRSSPDIGDWIFSADQVKEVDE